MKRICGLLIWFVCIGAAGSLHAQGSDCGITWQAPVTLSPDSVEASSGNVLAQGDTMHLVFVSGGFRLPYRRSTDGGMMWSPIQDLITDTIAFRFVGTRLIAGNRSKLIVLFSGGNSSSSDTPPYMMESTDRGESWTAPRPLLTDTFYIRNMSVLGDTIAILGHPNELLTDAVLSSTNSGTSWSLIPLSFFTGVNPRVALSSGWLHISYSYLIEGCQSFEISHRRSSDLGQTWEDSTLLSTCDDRGGGTVAIAATGNGNVHVTWTDGKYGCVGFGCSILMRRSMNHGATWLPEQVLTETPWGEASHVSIDSNNVLVTWGRASILFHIEARVSTDGGESWCPIIDLTPNVSALGTASPQWNTLSRERLIVAWAQHDTATVPWRVLVRIGMIPPVAVEEGSEEQGEGIVRYNPFPNPFNASTRIGYGLPARAWVRGVIYNVLGAEIATLIDDIRDPGSHEVVWDAGNTPSGIYFYRFTLGTVTSTGKLLLLR